MLLRWVRAGVLRPWLSVSPRPGTRASVLLVALLVTAQTVLHLGNRLTLGTPALDVNREQTVFSLTGALVIAAAAVGAALVVRAGTPPVRALLLAGLLAFLAVDEFFAVHEPLGVRAAAALGLSADYDSVLWPVVYLPLVGLVLLLVVRLAREGPDDIGPLLLTGLACLVAAVVLEVVSYPFSTAVTGPGPVHALEGAVEEGLELAGWGLLASALWCWALTPGWRPR